MNLKRRDFLKAGSLGAGGLMLTQFVNQLEAAPKAKPARVLFFVQGYYPILDKKGKYCLTEKHKRHPKPPVKVLSFSKAFFRGFLSFLKTGFRGSSSFLKAFFRGFLAFLKALFTGFFKAF